MLSDRHPAAVGFSPAAQAELEVGWRQQEVLNEFLVDVGRAEVRVGSHGGAPRMEDTRSCSNAEREGLGADSTRESPSVIDKWEGCCQ